jgi:predicted O-linked N-acetylglucosamine transferase (SPINDLY family)
VPPELGTALARPGPRASRTRTGAIGELIEAQRQLKAGQPELAERCCRRLLKALPDDPDAHNLLGLALGRRGRIREAERHSRRAVELRPSDPGFLANLAERLRQQNRLDEAIVLHRQALDLAPDLLPALEGLARALAAAGAFDAALEPALRARRAAPEIAGNHALAGELLALLRRHDEAVLALSRAVELAPERYDWWQNLARVCLTALDLERLERAARHLLERSPQDAEAKVHLANALFRKDAFGAVRELLEPVPVEGLIGANARNLLGVTLARQGRIEAGLEALEQVPVLAPEAAELQMNRLLHLNYDPDRSPGQLKREHLAWAERFARPLYASQFGCPQERDPDRRLRVGYLSPDLRRHSVAYFVAPLLLAHDRREVEAICYASVLRPDAFTDELRAMADGWVDVQRLDDAALAARIRADRIDVLVELAGHTRDSRLLACAYRPAPVQIGYIGYPNTTGVGAIDYRITDQIADPDGFDDHYCETLIRLPRCFLAYAAPRHAPDAGPPPFQRNGYITFGSFNNLAKINRRVIALWAEILNQVEGGCLVLKSAGTGDAETRAGLEAAFAAHGIAPERLRILPPAAEAQEHLAVYNEIDLALDPFPYNGTTTTCEALWMGVPVITLAGDRHAGRVGASLLDAVGFQAGIAATPEDYALTARLLASQPELLAAARRHLRSDLARSPLRDHEGHARAIEEAYRAVWQIWCAGQARC